MKKKIALVLVAVVLVAALAVGGTLAWLTAEADALENKFTVGSITLGLSEETGKDYHIIPGATIDKDPTVAVAKGSEKCYVYAEVENGLGSSATLNIKSADWEKIGEEPTTNTAVYRYIGNLATNNVVDAKSASVELPLFTKVKIDDGITDLSSLNETTITVDAFAHQSEGTEGVDMLATADAAACEYFKVTPTTTTP